MDQRKNIFIPPLPSKRNRPLAKGGVVKGGVELYCFCLIPLDPIIFTPTPCDWGPAPGQGPGVGGAHWVGGGDNEIYGV